MDDALMQEINNYVEHRMEHVRDSLRLKYEDKVIPYDKDQLKLFMDDMQHYLEGELRVITDEVEDKFGVKFEPIIEKVDIDNPDGVKRIIDMLNDGSILSTKPWWVELPETSKGTSKKDTKNWIQDMITDINRQAEQQGINYPKEGKK